MKGFFIGLVFAMFVVSIAEMIRKRRPDNKVFVKQEPCPPHRWQYIQKDGAPRMQCIKCEFIAGTHQSKNGEY